MMIPAGAITEDTFKQLLEIADEGDIIVDGGNSNFRDSKRRYVEAKHKGIVPFALTVDKEGHDYLGQMCGDMAYEVLGDIELLPSRLPTLYRRLTE